MASGHSHSPQKPCRACADFKQWAKTDVLSPSSPSAQPNAKSTQAGLATFATLAGVGVSAASSSSSSSTTPPPPPPPPPPPAEPLPTYSFSPTTNARCPPDGPELGHASWTFLHSVAAYYPDTPTPDDQASMRSFVRGLGRWYPCGYCAEHVRKVVDKDPPRVESRKDLAKWFCDLHNEVNVRLGKPIFDCAKVDERWRDGPKDGSCG